jgi:hypothetical protein
MSEYVQIPHTPPSRNLSGLVPGRRGWLCWLLAVSFLFNPFLAASTPTFGTVVNHLPSFRATVASSELLKFAPQQKIDVHASPECELANWFGLTPLTLDTPALLIETETPASARFALSGNVWFRPPPVV